MNFTTSFFLFICFPISVVGDFIIKTVCSKRECVGNRIRNIFLILFSLFFYGWTRSVGILCFIIYMVLVYGFGCWIQKSENTAKVRKISMAVSIVVVVAILLYYKYYNFVVQTFGGQNDSSIKAQTIIAPLGISFVTFSAISYLVDIYRKDAETGSLSELMLYLSFFPKVISGPIVLWKDFVPQIQNRKVSDSSYLEGLNRMMIGFAKKVILADTFGALVLEIQQQIGTLGISTLTSWGCALLYMLEIYYDFAGYSDIAIGIAKLFGFEFKENFHFPYISQSITEFWRRWHISLGTWFREYIYIPLGGNRKGKIRTLLNLGIVFLITGIWHGAGWNYIYWGILNGVCVIIERCIRDTSVYKKIPAVIKWAITMMIVLFGWQLFYYGALEDFNYFVDIMFRKEIFEEMNYTAVYYFSKKILVYMAVAMLGAVLSAWSKLDKIKEKLNSTKSGLVIQEVVLLGLMIVAVISMVNSTYSPFIYFQY